MNDLKTCNPKSTVLSSFVDSCKLYDDEIIFQREVCWDVRQERKLIASIIKGIPIGTVHLVRKNNSKRFDVLDGKQRKNAIQRWYAGDFAMYFKHKGNDIVPVLEEKQAELTLDWRAIEKKAKEGSDIYIDLEKTIKDFSMGYVEWEVMELDDKVELFKSLNYSEPFSYEEDAYLKNCVAKEFFRWIFENYLSKNFKDNIRTKNVRENHRCKGVKFVHSICVVAFGNNFDSGYKIVSTKTTELQPKAKYWHDKLYSLNVRDPKDFNEDFVKKNLDPKCLESLNRLKKMSSTIGQILYSNGAYSKKLGQSLASDLLIFFLWKEEDGVLTNSFMIENWEKFLNIMADYNKILGKNDNKVLEGVQASNVKKDRMKILEDLLIGSGLDLTKKNQCIPQWKSTDARLASDGKDPITGMALSSDAQEDHILCKSKHGESLIGMMNPASNRLKSNISPKQAEKFDALLNKDN